MDRNHTLEAPNNDELSTIEQIEDRSGISTVYRAPEQQFQGKILSAEEREKVKAEQLASITNDLWKSSLKIGLYIPYPFVSGILLAALLNSFVSFTNAGLMIGFLIIAVIAWGASSVNAYVRIFKIFYKHALRTGPFLFVLLLSVLLASQAMYEIVAKNFGSQSVVFNIALVSILVILYSILSTFIVLIVWSNSKIKGIYKVAVAGAVVVVSAFLAISSYLL